MLSEQIFSKIHDFLSTNYSVNVDDGAYYTFEVFVPPGFTRLLNDDLISMFSMGRPREYLQDILDADANEFKGILLNQLFLELSKDLLELSNGSKDDYELLEHQLDRYLSEYIETIALRKPILDTKFNSHFVIGGENEVSRAFTLNSLEGDVLQDGALKWLIKQQGYNINDFNDIILGKVPLNEVSPFFKSIYEELYNLPSKSSKLTILSKFKLSDLIDWDCLLRNKKALTTLKDYTITIPKDCRIGLVDTFTGAGSLIEIVLEKDLVIPLSYIYQVKPDEYYKHSIKDIYGPTDSFWSDFSIKVPKESISYIYK